MKQPESCGSCSNCYVESLYKGIGLGIPGFIEPLAVRDLFGFVTTGWVMRSFTLTRYVGPLRVRCCTAVLPCSYIAASLEQLVNGLATMWITNVDSYKRGPVQVQYTLAPTRAINASLLYSLTIIYLFRIKCVRYLVYIHWWKTANSETTRT